MEILPAVMVTDLGFAAIIATLWRIAPTRGAKVLCIAGLVWVGVFEAFGHVYLEKMASWVMGVAA